MTTTTRTLAQLIRDLQRGDREQPSTAYAWSGGRKHRHRKPPYSDLSTYGYTEGTTPNERYDDYEYSANELDNL